MKIIIMW